ncbi:MAG: cation diffusion facilitator family transporter [Cyanobacteria bacterium CRU_2_1]|nr:cation diffusion facilitator family transporter [Cyanobacteria bacterium RU_5_0]NJR62787.1 cation diffusion facilitator family transporter [Cyanobacteria bacterium CRU_2_1]
MIEAQSRYQASYRILFVTLWLTLLILAVKVWAGLATRSLSLLVDSLHTLVDSFSTLLSLMTVSSLHQTSGWDIRGHRKRDAVMVLLVVAFLGFAGFSLLSGAVYQLLVLIRDPSRLPTIDINLPLITLLTVVVAIHVCLVLFERYEGRVLASSPLRHNANHILQDVWLTILMLLGLIGVSLGLVWLDSLMTLGLLVMLLFSVWQVLSRQLPSLLCQMAIAPEAIAQIAVQVEGVSECRQIRSQGVIGRHIFVQMHLRLHPEFMNAAHLITERLENILRERYGSVQTKISVETIRTMKHRKPK